METPNVSTNVSGEVKNSAYPRTRDFLRSRTHLPGIFYEKANPQVSNAAFPSSSQVHDLVALKLAQLKRETRKLRKKLENNRNELDNKNQEISELKREKDHAIAKLTGKQCIVDDLQNYLQTLTLLVTSHQGTSKLFSEEDFAELSNNISSILAELTKYKEQTRALQTKNNVLSEEKKDLRLLNESLESELQSFKTELSYTHQAVERQNELIRNLQSEIRGKSHELFICKQKLAQTNSDFTAVEVPELLIELQTQNKNMKTEVSDLQAALTKKKDEMKILQKQNQELKIRVDKLQRGQDNLVRQLQLPKPKNTVKELRAMKGRLDQLSGNSSPANSPRSPPPPRENVDVLFTINVQVEKAYKTFLNLLNRSKDQDVSQYYTDRTGYCTVEHQLNSIILLIQEQIEVLLDSARPIGSPRALNSRSGFPPTRWSISTK